MLAGAAGADGGGSSSRSGDSDRRSNSCGGSGNGGEDGLGQRSSCSEDHSFGDGRSLGHSGDSGGCNRHRCQTQTAAGRGDRVTGEARLDSRGRGLARGDGGGSWGRSGSVDRRRDLRRGDSLARVDRRRDLRGADDRV